MGWKFIHDGREKWECNNSVKCLSFCSLVYHVWSRLVFVVAVFWIVVIIIAVFTAVKFYIGEYYYSILPYIYHEELSSQSITLYTQIFTVKNWKLQSTGLVVKYSVFRTWQFWSLLFSHLRIWVSFNVLSTQRLIFRLQTSLD